MELELAIQMEEIGIIKNNLIMNTYYDAEPKPNQKLI